MELEFNEKQRNAIIKCLQNKKTRIDKYITIMNSNKIDKNLYKSYYTMNRSIMLDDDNYYNVYFNYLEELKRNNTLYDFGTILKYLCKNTTADFISPSYASKLLATLDPNKPVWDSNVLGQLQTGLDKQYKNIQTEYYKTKDQEQYIENLISIYKQLEYDLKNRKNKEELKDIFNVAFSENHDFLNITDMKKIDIVLWVLGSKKCQDMINEKQD